MNIQATTPTTVDLATIKSRQQVAWSSSDYAIVGTTLQIVGEMLCQVSRSPQQRARPRRRRWQRQCDARRSPPLRRRRVDGLRRRAS